MRLTPKQEPEYFQWGSLVHRYAEETERGKGQNEILSDVYEEIENRMEHLRPQDVDRLECMLSILPIVFQAHTDVWGETDKHFETLEPERKFSWELPDSNNWFFEGKIDATKRDLRNGKCYQWERKTAARTGPTYWRRIPLDSQPKGYILTLQRAIGLPIDSVIYDIYKKPAVSRGKYESLQAYWAKTALMYQADPVKYMERGPYKKQMQPIQFNAEQLEEYYWNQIQVTQMLDWHLTEHIWPKNHPFAGGCTYQPLCEAKSDAEFASKINELFYVRTDFHPEL